MREAFVGFDSAWTDRNRGGIAYATFADDRLVALPDPELVRFEDAARIVERLRDECRYVLVAIDQPTLVPNETGMRPVERVAAALISRLGGGVQPAFRGKRAMFGPDAPVWRFLDRIVGHGTWNVPSTETGFTRPAVPDGRWRRPAALDSLHDRVRSPRPGTLARGG